jgi:hypothetical protein
LAPPRASLPDRRQYLRLISARIKIWLMAAKRRAKQDLPAECRQKQRHGEGHELNFKLGIAATGQHRQFLARGWQHRA